MADKTITSKDLIELHQHFKAIYNPIQNKVVMIPAQVITKEIEVTALDENGNSITVKKQQKTRYPLPPFVGIYNECLKNNTECYLSEHLPEKDENGKPSVMMIDKKCLNNYGR